MSHSVHHRGRVRGNDGWIEGGDLCEELLSFMDFIRRKIVLREDNQGAIALAENPVGSNNSKHIEVRVHFIREKAGLGDVEVFHVESAQQHADILTKPLGRGSFELYRDFLLGRGS